MSYEIHWWKARLKKDAPFIGVRTFFGPPLIGGDEIDRSWRWQAVLRNEDTGRAILMGDHIPIEVEGNATLRNLEKISEP